MSSPASVRNRGAAAKEAEADADPLLAACRMVGAAIGVRLLRPRAWGEQAGHHDPVESIARASSVRVRRVLLRGEWWRTDSGPLVTFREGGRRPVALLTSRPNRYWLYDPAEHAWTKVDRRVAVDLEPSAYSFYRPFPERAIGLVELLRFGVVGCRREIAIIL